MKIKVIAVGKIKENFSKKWLEEFEKRLGAYCSFLVEEIPAEPILDELTELLEQEFSLPYFEFVYDEHWDLGHGWSGDMPK